MRSRRDSVAREQARVEWEALARDLVAGLWRWRVELLVTAVMGTVWLVLRSVVDGLVAGAVAAVAVGGRVQVRTARDRTLRLFAAVRVRRAWERAVLDVGAARGPLTGPRVISVRSVAAGELLRVVVHRGFSV